MDWVSTRAFTSRAQNIERGRSQLRYALAQSCDSPIRSSDDRVCFRTGGISPLKRGRKFTTDVHKTLNSRRSPPSAASAGLEIEH